jgi:hypothetical protein
MTDAKGTNDIELLRIYSISQDTMQQQEDKTITMCKFHQKIFCGNKVGFKNSVTKWNNISSCEGKILLRILSKKIIQLFFLVICHRIWGHFI